MHHTVRQRPKEHEREKATCDAVVQVSGLHKVPVNVSDTEPQQPLPT
jgi:hypothetical protein